MESLLKTFDLQVIDLKMIIFWALAFVVLWRLLAKFFIKPYMALLDAREAATIAARATAAELNRSAEDLQAEYERRLAVERVKFMQQKLEALERARAESASIVDTAERESKHYRDSFRAELEKSLDELRRASVAQAGSVAAMLVEKLKRIPQDQHLRN